MTVSARVTAPCKGCTDRSVTCHSSCERYKQYKQELENAKTEERKEAELYDLTMALTSNLRKKKYDKIRGRKYK